MIQLVAEQRRVVQLVVQIEPLVLRGAQRAAQLVEPRDHGVVLVLTVRGVAIDVERRDVEEERHVRRVQVLGDRAQRAGDGMAGVVDDVGLAHACT